jgi:thymidylate kinase
LLDLGGIVNWIFDQWARYAVMVWPALRQGDLVLVDRYSFDLAYREPWSLAYRPLFTRFICGLFPTPDRTYLLWEDPRVMAARKNEASPDELEELLRRLRVIVRHVPRTRQICTDASVERTAASIATDVATLIESRCGLRC